MASAQNTKSGPGLKPRTIKVTLNYYDDPGDGSLPAPVIVGAKSVENKRTVIPVAVAIRDITDEENHYRLDTHGFELCKHEAATADFSDEARLRTVYFPEIQTFIQERTGAFYAHIFDHKLRRGPANWHALGPNNVSSRGPLHRVHVDQSYYGARLVLDHSLSTAPDTALAAAASRARYWLILNVWRPLRTVNRDPLAVASALSVPETDLVAARIVYPDRQGETWTVRNGLSRLSTQEHVEDCPHKWFYKRRQSPEEVWLIKCFDSREGPGIARRAPHSAFTDPETREEDGPRESIEVRALVFYE